MNGLSVVLFLMLGVLLARSRPNAAILSAVFAVCLKLTPCFSDQLLALRRGTALAVVGLLFAGFVLPLFVLENYRYIYGFHATRDIGPIVRALGTIGVSGAHASTVAAVAGWFLPLTIGGAFSVVLLYAQYKLDFTWEDRIGWAAVPFSLLFSLRMLSMRTLFESMVLPDRRRARSLWVFGMGLVDMALRASGVRTLVRDGVWDVCGLVGLFLNLPPLAATDRYGGASSGLGAGFSARAGLAPRARTERRRRRVTARLRCVRFHLGGRQQDRTQAVR